MREQLRAYVLRLFAQAPDTQRNRELREEILQNTLDRFDDLVAQGVPEESAYTQAVGSIGDVENLIEPAPKKKQTPWGAIVLGTLAAVLVIALVLFLALRWEAPRREQDNWVDSLTDWAEDMGEAAAEWGEQIGEDAAEWGEQIGEEVSDWIDGSYQLVYGNADQYSIGAGSISAQGISRVEIYWQAGSVTVEPGDGDAITLTETGADEEKYELRYLVEGGALTIRFAEAGTYRSLPSKDLTVTLPAALEELWLDTVSASVEVAESPIQGIHMETVSGECSLAGNLTVLEWESVSGRLTFTGSAMEIQGESVSGGAAFHLTETPSRFTCDTVSGDVSLTIPGERSFEAKLNTTSGDLRCDLPTQTVGKNTLSYEANGDAAAFTVDTVSGDFIIQQS